MLYIIIVDQQLMRICEKGASTMLDYCLCPKCERMIMLDSEYPTGFCLYCGTHIAYDEAREDFLGGLRSAIPDEFVLEVDLSELIDEDDAEDNDGYGVTECREECEKAQKYMGKWDFAKAYEHYSRALEWRPADFEAACGRMTSGILKLNDVENWESRARDCTALIRSQGDWNMAQKSLEYALDILKKFLSKGGRFVAPYYTYGFFRLVIEKFPALIKTATDIFAHCLNIDNAPLTNAARLDDETTRFAVGSFSPEPDKNLRYPLLLVLKHCDDDRKVEELCRALYVFDRVAWLRNRDNDRINDVIGFLELVYSDPFTEKRRGIAVKAAYDLLMMGGLEHNTTLKEKQLFLTRVYSYEQMQRMERFFGEDIFFRRVQGEVYLKSAKALPSSPEYRRIQDKIRELAANYGTTDYYNR
ncbi:MAG: hypothetical protein E7478_03340 [Ruminococcaceae bacterium]|nr:hypothetical protein [Oscillospiraceae bacterium]